MDDLLPEIERRNCTYQVAPDAKARDLGLFTLKGFRSHVTLGATRRYTRLPLPELRARLLLAGGKLRYYSSGLYYGWFTTNNAHAVSWWSEEFAIAEYLVLRDTELVG